MQSFDEVRFPLEISLRSRGGPERRTEVVTLASGRETRNARWAHARRRYEAGQAVRSLQDLALVVAFFEERRGRLIGFRFKDRLDCQSSPPGQAPQATDQTLGQGDGTQRAFPLIKRYGTGPNAYVRPIAKPVAGTVKIAVGGAHKTPGADYDLDSTTGLVTFRPGQAPAAGQAVTAGFEFDVPVRFDSDRLEVDHLSFAAGDIPSIPLVEILP